MDARANGEERPDTVRPFRVWDERSRNDVAHRCYLTENSAIDHVLVMLYWLELGNSYTIYDARSGRVVRQFVRRINGIIILE